MTPIPRRQPWQVARNLATLGRLSEGRVILGSGLGREFDYASFGEAWEPKELGRKYDEALDIVAGLWRGDAFSYDGNHYTVDEAVVLPTPVQQPRTPIIVGGVWPNKKPFHRGARWDGIVPHYRGDGVSPKMGAYSRGPPRRISTRGRGESDDRLLSQPHRRPRRRFPSGGFPSPFVGLVGGVSRTRRRMGVHQAQGPIRRMDPRHGPDSRGAARLMERRAAMTPAITTVNGQREETYLLTSTTPRSPRTLTRFVGSHADF